MGYRSEWKMAFKAETKEKLDSVLDYIKSIRGEEEYSWVPDSILECAKKETHGNTIVEFSGEWWKCYDPWDDCIKDIEAYCEENTIAFAYVRVGEDINDVDERSDSEVFYFESTRIGKLVY